MRHPRAGRVRDADHQGQRRAFAVRDYYIQLGVASTRIGTLSYGEEKPLDLGHTEASWAKNRRAETKVRSAQSGEQPLSE